MNHNEADRLINTEGDYLTSAEVNVYRALLAVVDFRDCSVPPFMTPRIMKLASGCRLSVRTTRRALGHLHLHGWVSYQAGRGRGNLGKFRLVPRVPDSVCTCEKRGHVRPLSEEKRGHQTHVKGDTKSGHVAGQSRFGAKGREGEVVEGPVSLATVTPIYYPSTSSPAADRLWSLGLEA